MSSVLPLRRFSFINYYISMAGGLWVLTCNILPETVTMQILCLSELIILVIGLLVKEGYHTRFLKNTIKF